LGDLVSELLALPRVFKRKGSRSRPPFTSSNVAEIQVLKQLAAYLATIKTLTLQIAPFIIE
jgi:hypothetical protein